MEPPENKTHAVFFLLGFTDMPHLLLPLASFFMASYVLCIAGNIFISSLVISQQNLHTPMYVFMANLAFVDAWFTSITTPRALYGLLSGDTYISINDCFVQLFMFLAVSNLNAFLLTTMAFDRFFAICFPLRYLIIINKRTCICLLAISWIMACFRSTFYTVSLSSQPFCSWFIPHYFCDVPVLMILSCTDFSASVDYVDSIETCIFMFGPVLFIIGTYIFIIRTVLALQSSQRRWKTFSTCSSHLFMVILLYSTVIFMYSRPNSIYSPAYDRVISIVFNTINPTLNLIIYSLRNKEIKNAVRKMLK